MSFYPTKRSFNLEEFRRVGKSTSHSYLKMGDLILDQITIYPAEPACVVLWYSRLLLLLRNTIVDTPPLTK